jgi:hypothetical protein
MIASRRRQAATLAAAGLLAIAVAARAEAATCAEEIALLAEQYDLSGAPHAAQGPGSAPREAASGSAQPRSGSGVPLSATKRARMEAFLNAARAADQQRKTAECFERLSEARAIPEPG